MQNDIKTEVKTAPRLLSIKQTAKEGPLTEYALRLMEKQGKLPCVYVGCKCLINYDLLIEQLGSLGPGLGGKS